MIIRFISADEVIAFHDRIMSMTPGVKGMPDAGRAEAIMYRVLNQHIYEGINDIFELAATHLLAISRGHIFNDGNKRTALFITLLFLRRNEIKIASSDSLVDLTVQAAAGKLSKEMISHFLQSLTE